MLVIDNPTGQLHQHTPNDLPSQPDALPAGPDIVFLYPAGGFSSSTIYLDNLNLGEFISWQVASNAGWVELSATSGTTPQVFTETASLTAFDYGVHKFLLTFSDPGGLYEPVSVSIVATIPEYDLFMPALVR